MKRLGLVLLPLLIAAAPEGDRPASAPEVSAPEASALRPARVAIIDSGIARTPELGTMLVAEYDMASDQARAPFQPRYDHGTMVATILARAAAQPVEIVSFRIDDPAGCPAKAVPPCQPSAVPIVEAIRRATSMGVDAINISLSLAPEPSITEAVREASARGVLVVLAAGNEGRDHPGNLAMARAGYPHAVLVGAKDVTGKVWSGTNRPDAEPQGYSYVWQLGVNVPTTAADGRTLMATGTSFATPIETAQRLRELPRIATLAAVH